MPSPMHSAPNVMRSTRSSLCKNQMISAWAEWLSKCGGNPWAFRCGIKRVFCMGSIRPVSHPWPSRSFIGPRVANAACARTSLRFLSLSRSACAADSLPIGRTCRSDGGKSDFRLPPSPRLHRYVEVSRSSTALRWRASDGQRSSLGLRCIPCHVTC
jgi:hypothetical protein